MVARNVSLCPRAIAMAWSAALLSSKQWLQIRSSDCVSGKYLEHFTPLKSDSDSDCHRGCSSRVNANNASASEAEQVLAEEKHVLLPFRAVVADDPTTKAAVVLPTGEAKLGRQTAGAHIHVVVVHP